MVAVSLGPNIGYVLVALSDTVSYKTKVVSEAIIVFVKIVLSTVIIPQLSRHSVNWLIPHTTPGIRFRLRVTLNTALAVISTILIPLATVMFTDKRCFYYALRPQESVTTDVHIEYCAIYDSGSHTCNRYASTDVESTYLPPFRYSGERCVSAILSVYAPIYLTTVLSAAVLPAFLECIIVPLVALQCYRAAPDNKIARWIMFLLKGVTWNVSSTLALAGERVDVDVDVIIQRIIERAYVQLIATLLVALSYGISVPVVGGASVVAAAVQFVHNLYVFSQTAALSALSGEALAPTKSLAYCCALPPACAFIIATAILIFWVSISVDFLLEFEAAIAAMVTIAVCVCTSKLFPLHRSSVRGAGQSGAEGQNARIFSGSTSPGDLLLEPFVES
jgi:hypothetical protein